MFKKFNMVRTGLLFVVLTAGMSVCFGQMYWTKSYDTKNTWPIAMKLTKDGNYIVAGNYSNAGWVAKLNTNGDTLWTKTYAVSTFNYFYSIESIDGEFFLLFGECSSNSQSGLENGWVVKINSNGDIIWSRTYEIPGETLCFTAIQKCVDGNFLIAGVSSTKTSNTSGCIFKITPGGETLWTRSSGGKIFSIQASSDENYMVSGALVDSVSGESEIFLMKINNAGKTIWTKSFANSRSQHGDKILPTSDGNYLLLGYSSWYDTIGKIVTYHRSNVFIMKITPEGDSIWTRIYSSPAFENQFFNILSSEDGNFLISGLQHTVSTFDKAWLLKINQNGDTLWTRTSSGPQGIDGFSKVLLARNEKYMVLISVGGKWSISCMVEDQYANKNSPFSYKIPTRGLDSLNCGYQPLKVPSGMTVSAGGTVSWIPQTESSYLENAKFVIVDDQGRKDTLSLNIFVNMKNQPSHIGVTHRVSKDKVSDVFTVTSHLERGNVQFIGFNKNKFRNS
jgi:hypothetical protein